MRVTTGSRRPAAVESGGPHGPSSAPLGGTPPGPTEVLLREARRRQRRRWALSALALVAAAGLIAGVASAFNGSPPPGKSGHGPPVPLPGSGAAAGTPKVTVPDVLGLLAPKAAYRIGLVHLKMACRRVAGPPTSVVKQRPPPGTDVARGSVVTILSTGEGCQLAEPLPVPPPAVSPTTPVPALRTLTPKMVVMPSTGLTNGERVVVAVTGFGAGGKFWISECASAADANPLGCGPQLAAQPFGKTDTSGAGSYGFTVTSTAPTRPYDTSSPSALPCAEQCVIVAAVGDSYADMPITFAGG